MAFKFNALTGKLDLYNDISIQEVLKSILIESDETLALLKAEILFDEDSILYNEDGAI